MLSVIALSVIVLNVVMLSVVAPLNAPPDYSTNSKQLMETKTRQLISCFGAAILLVVMQGILKGEVSLYHRPPV
jgi:hypothetical protein